MHKKMKEKIEEKMEREKEAQRKMKEGRLSNCDVPMIQIPKEVLHLTEEK